MPHAQSTTCRPHCTEPAIPTTVRMVAAGNQGVGSNFSSVHLHKSATQPPTAVIQSDVDEDDTTMTDANKTYQMHREFSGRRVSSPSMRDDWVQPAPHACQPKNTAAKTPLRRPWVSARPQTKLRTDRKLPVLYYISYGYVFPHTNHHSKKSARAGGDTSIIKSKFRSTSTVALIKFASRSLLTKLHLKKKSGGRKTRR